MYNPHRFEETRLDVLHTLIQQHPLGTLVTQGTDGLAADHIPFEIGAPTDAAPFGVLRAHVARANPLWRLSGSAVLAIFQGPSAYISPSLFAEKAISGKVVPTWNYATVHASGTLTAIEDRAWLLALVNRLTDHYEAPRGAPWAVADAPRPYIEAMLNAIVGIEIPITRLQGKWKINQDDPAADRVQIATGLGAEPGGAKIAAIMQSRQPAES
ncbi:MAG: FMN-binding negative transcriptional regulator [Pseudomonadota bacterium]|nr:FMN-binding negative transcriptional regulator [Pseudomonadota bacterium]